METEYGIFLELGFSRRKCVICGKYFWSAKERTTCGEPPCDRYTFIGNKIVPRSYTVAEMRRKFLDFFRDTHGYVKPYPVVPRWREDVLLVNASIYDFQPHVTGGYAKPPENPLVMSQPCIRMTDVDMVGITGRHLTGFEMMCHDAFNYPGKEVYWKEGTIRYCNSFLTDGLGIDPVHITYKENPWSGGGNAGNALEVIVGGLEVATLVFMDMAEDPDGNMDIDGIRYSPMDLRIVDTGYGLERLTWLSRSSGTIYEAVYPEVVSRIMEAAGIEPMNEDWLLAYLDNAVHSEPYDDDKVLRNTIAAISLNPGSDEEKEFLSHLTKIRSVYALADHSRALLFMLSNYVIPSNVKVGYLARMLIRRSLRHIESLGVDITLPDLINMQYKHYIDIVEDFDTGFSEMLISRELGKYREMMTSGRLLLDRLLRSKKEIGTKEVRMLYESHGIPPEIVKQLVLERTGKKLELHGDERQEKKEFHTKSPAITVPRIETRPLYYDDKSIREFTALVLFSGPDYVVLNQTAFYPEGGGQPNDTGYIYYGSRGFRVTNVQKVNGTIVHWIDGHIPEKVRVRGIVDDDRRNRLMTSHSATHLLLAVTREVLGNHVWQSGVQKGTETSRLDITHYDRITEEQIRKIEKRCMHYIMEGREIKVKMVEWNSALKKYGFRLFQGGVPLSSKLRVVEIEGVDAEGCGGTHLDSTAEIGMIKILKAEPLQEGIQRIVFASGYGSLEYFEKIQSITDTVTGTLAANIDEAGERFMSFFEQNLRTKKERDSYLGLISDIIDQNATNVQGHENIRYFPGEFPEAVVTQLIPRLKDKPYTILLIVRSGSGRRLMAVSGNADSASALRILSGGLLNIHGNQKMSYIDIDAENERLISEFLNRRN